MTDDAQTRFEFWIAQRPLLDVSVKPVEPEGVAVKVAQVPPMYHVPAVMMQPSGALLPEGVTWRVPLPEKGVPGAVVGPVPEDVVVVGEVPEPDLGRYLTPVAGQSDDAPSKMIRLVEFERERQREGGLAWIGGDECSRLHAALDVVKIPNFVQLIGVLALNNSSDTSRCFQRRQNSRRCIRCCG